MDAHNSTISHMAAARSAELRREAEARGLARIARKRSRRAARARFGGWLDRRRRAPRSAPALPVLHPDAAPGPVDADLDVAVDEGLRQTA
jgi:hypothetical protein